MNIPPWIKALTAYRPGRPINDVAREFGLDPSSIIKLASNENPWGMGELAKEALVVGASGAARYPDGHGLDLKQTLCQFYPGVQIENIILGNGSNEVLDIAARAFLQPKAAAVYSQYSFLVYSLATQTMGAEGIAAKAASGFAHDPQTLLAAITEKTRILFIANPNNPTGTWLPPVEIKALLDKIPKHILVVLDEAYDDYLPDEIRSPSVQWLSDHENLLITRTFSKLHGLAGLRVGYGLAQAKLADILNRVRLPFNVSSLAQRAACAALKDTHFIEQSRRNNDLGLHQLRQGCEKLGIGYLPSYANFIAVEVGDGLDVFNKLQARGIIVRPLMEYGMPQYLRITVGKEEENQKVLAELRDILQR